MAVERLSKFLAHSGVASRRKADVVIKSGRVKVNGVTVVDPFFRVTPGEDRVTLDGARVSQSSRLYYVALYKPVGYLSDLADPRGRPLARSLIEIETQLFPVGRLDYNSEGLMIFTNDGEFANTITHPRYGVEKEYLVKLSGRLTREEQQRMIAGVHVEGHLLKLKSIAAVEETDKNTWYGVVVTEGRNRMIRKMAEAIAHPVLKLKRVRIDGISLGHLKPGEYRLIDPRQIAEMRTPSRKRDS
jgi:23S rRNA pseudouridine2605 synthase